jgi:hypothetical protein
MGLFLEEKFGVLALFRQCVHGITEEPKDIANQVARNIKKFGEENNLTPLF